MLERRAGINRSHYSDGCAKPIIEKATREDGSLKNLFPKPGDGEVARRAGHGVEVLLKVYAGCIDGDGGTDNQRIEDALGE